MHIVFYAGQYTEFVIKVIRKYSIGQAQNITKNLILLARILKKFPLQTF